MYYAVKKGKKPGIYENWPLCQEQVTGYSGAVYKKFKTEKEALDFLHDNEEKSENKEITECSENEIIAYVDGSFRLEDRTFSYGVYLTDGKTEEMYSKRFYNEDSSMRNVSGEIRGAMKAMERAIELGKEKLYIHYDYRGIEDWALGNWKANKEGTKDYKNYYDSIKDRLDVSFVKVKAHSGVKYNEIADKLAKEAE